METGVSSGITHVTQVDKQILEKARDRKANFEYWGPTPREARKAAVAKKKGLLDKRMTIKVGPASKRCPSRLKRSNRPPAWEFFSSTVTCKPRCAR